jgi:hypothetical protein
MPTTRPEMIAHLVTVANQWGMKTKSGKDYTTESFARASDEWLTKQIKKSFAGGKRLAS